jgi:V-type H+-transporting ATPase subunit G
VQKLKDARTEAEKEIELLKQQKIQEYKDYEKSVLGSLDESMQEYRIETESKVKEVERLGQEKTPEMVQLLLGSITKVETSLHQNIVT